MPHRRIKGDTLIRIPHKNAIFQHKMFQKTACKKDHISCKGFTLIELLVGIAVTGILATIAIQSYRGYIKKQK